MTKKLITRTLLDGREVKELQKAITLKVYTKCPEKWMLVDLQTGQRYIGYPTKGSNSWKSLDNA